MFTQNYRWRAGDRRWRRKRVREAARRFSGLGRRSLRLRAVLSAVLCLELAVGARQLWTERGPDIQFLRYENSCSVEWVEPGSEEDGKRQVYGVRLRPDSLELQFYRQSREILPPE